jgi:hypothetical protein
MHQHHIKNDDTILFATNFIRWVDHIPMCIMLHQGTLSGEEMNQQFKFQKFPINFIQYYSAHLQLHCAVHTFNMMPIRLVSEVNGNTCMMVYECVTPAGVRRCILDRSRLTRAKPTSSVHFTKATCQETDHSHSQNENVKVHIGISIMS